MRHVKPIDVTLGLRPYRKFFFIIRQLQLTSHIESLRNSVDFFERFDFCRYLQEGDKYNIPCRHRT